MDTTSPGHSRWLPQDIPPEGQRAALHRLAAAIRRLNGLLMETDAPEDAILTAAEGAERFAEQLETGPRHRALWGFAESANSGDTRAFFDNSPIFGLANPIAPPLVMTMDGSRAQATANFGIAYEGPPGHVHGGWIAASFDEVLGMVQSASGTPGMTGTLTVRYRQPTPLYREVRFEGRLDHVDGRKIFTTGSLWADETLCAEADAVFISVDFERMHEIAASGLEGAA